MDPPERILQPPNENRTEVGSCWTYDRSKIVPAWYAPLPPRPNGSIPRQPLWINAQKATWEFLTRNDIKSFCVIDKKGFTPAGPFWPRLLIEATLDNGTTMREVGDLPLSLLLEDPNYPTHELGFRRLRDPTAINRANMNKKGLMAVQDVVNQTGQVSEYNLSPVTRSIAALSGVGPKPGNKLAGRRKTKKKRKSSTSRGIRSRP
jgi:hypothetical protein